MDISDRIEGWPERLRIVASNAPVSEASRTCVDMSIPSATVAAGFRAEHPEITVQTGVSRDRPHRGLNG